MIDIPQLPPPIEAYELDSDEATTWANLKHGYEWLKTAADIDPSIRRDFDPRIFGVYFNTLKSVLLKNNVCGTAGSLLGHMARAFVIKPEYFDIVQEFNYLQFTRAVMPALIQGFYHTIVWNEIFEYLFMPCAYTTTPDFDTMLERLRDFIERGEMKVPTNNN